jgi:hypothetical protein
VNLDLLTVAHPDDICERGDAPACAKCGARIDQRCQLPVRQVLVPSSLLRDVSDYLTAQIDALKRDYTDPVTEQVDPEVTDEIAEVRGWIKQLADSAGD